MKIPTQVLNTWLNGSHHVRACEQWDVEELQELQTMLYMLRHSHFDDIYQLTKDNRRMRSETLQVSKCDRTSLNNCHNGMGIILEP